LIGGFLANFVISGIEQAGSVGTAHPGFELQTFAFIGL